MGLESATYVSDLVSSNPTGGDLESQGDDHLRLIKAVLQATFPNADRARRFRHIISISSNYTVQASDDQGLLVVAAAVTVTLPTGSSVYAGYEITVINTSTGTVTINAGLGDTINGSSSITITTQYEARRLTYTGTEWVYLLAPPAPTSLLTDSVKYDHLAVHPDEKQYNMGLLFSGDGWELAGGASLANYNDAGVPASAPASKVVKFDHSAGADQSMRQSDYVSVSGGEVYEITVDLARTASVANNNSVLLYPRWLDAGKSLISIDSTGIGDWINSQTVDTWNTYRSSFTAPAGAAFLDLKLFGYNYNNPSSAVVYATNCKVRRAIRATAIVAGAVSNTAMADNSIGTAELIDDAVTLAKLAAGVAGELISYDASGNPTTIAAGNAGEVLTSAGAGATPSFQSLISTYESAEQTITSAGTLTLAHGLGKRPFGVFIELVCQTAEGGYSAGDRVFPHTSDAQVAAAVARGATVVADATNLTVRYGSDSNVFQIVRKDNGNLLFATNANWKAVFKAWAV